MPSRLGRGRVGELIYQVDASLGGHMMTSEIQSGTTIRHLGTAGSNPLAPTIQVGTAYPH
jgi:hypothetical protein